MKTRFDKSKQEEETLKSDINDYERKIAKANIDIEKVQCVEMNVNDSWWSEVILL